MIRNSYLQYVSPLPDLPTGIAQYSRDLLTAVDGTWPMRVFGEEGSNSLAGLTIHSFDWSQFDTEAPAIYQIGNSEFHEHASRLSLKYPGIVVLHDTVLHHSRFSRFVRQGRSRDYLDEVQVRYGDSGLKVAREFLQGRIPANVSRFPLSESFIESARAVAVHNQFAREQVQQRFPDVLVQKIPMGIPLLRRIERKQARIALGLPETSFLIVSISHINPQKRIPVLFRAVRRLVERVPDTQCIVAGTPAPELGYERMVATLGLKNTVAMPGYVPDNIARLLIASSDVCVNLRFPSNGETSASQLRMLGAGRPVVVSGGTASEDLPEEVGLRVPVDRYEEEMLAELLFELYIDSEFRFRAGSEARSFIENTHTMQHMVEGYRQLVGEVYGIRLSDIPSTSYVEIEPVVMQTSIPLERRVSKVDRLVESAILDLGLESEELLMKSVAGSMVNLDLDKLPKDSQRDDQERDIGNFVDRLQCPECQSSLRYQQQQLTCDSCGSIYPIYEESPMFNIQQRD